MKERRLLLVYYRPKRVGPKPVKSHVLFKPPYDQTDRAHFLTDRMKCCITSINTVALSSTNSSAV